MAELLQHRLMDRQMLCSLSLLPFNLTEIWFPGRGRRYSTDAVLHRQSTPQNSLDGTLPSKVSTGTAGRQL